MMFFMTSYQLIEKKNEREKWLKLISDDKDFEYSFCE